MPKFSYKVKDPQGKTVTGLLEGPDAPAVSKNLKSQGYFVIEISEVGKKLGINSALKNARGVGKNDIVNMTRQLAVMLTTGLTLTDGLAILRNQANNQKLQKLLSDIVADIEGGQSFSKALEKHPNVFTSNYIAVIRSGEVSGLLDKMLNRLADNLERERDFDNKTKGALVYPMIIVIGMAIVMAIMMLFVIPTLTNLYSELNADLPLPTLIVIAISNFFVNFWYIVLGLIIGSYFGFQTWKSSESGRYILDGFLLQVPVWGTLQRNINLAEMTRTVGLLAGSGTPIIEALQNTAKSARNERYSEAMMNVSKKIEKGMGLGTAFSQDELFPPLVAQMARVGEETGKLDEVMLKTSAYFEGEAERIIKALTTILEPVILAVLGVSVGFLIISVILPIYNLTSKIG